jgi:DNA-binding beta-propeller fold protein YncE
MSFKTRRILGTLMGISLVSMLANSSFATPADDMAAKVATTDFLTPGTPIMVGPTGHFDYMTIDAKNQRVFASHPGTKSLTVVDLAKNTATDMPLGAEVNGVAVDSKDNLFLTAGGGQKVFALDRDTLAQKGELDLPGPGDGICFDKDNDTLYVDNDEDTNLWAVDPVTMKITATITIGKAPEYMRYDSATKMLYQCIKVDNEIQVIDTTTNTVAHTWSLLPLTSPHGLVFDKKSNRLYAACRPGVLAVVDSTTGKTLSTTPIASNVDQIEWDSKMRKIFCPGGGQLTVISLDDNGDAATVGRVAIDPGAHTCTVDNKNHTLWICYAAKDGNSYVQPFTYKAN